MHYRSIGFVGATAAALGVSACITILAESMATSSLARAEAEKQVVSQTVNSALKGNRMPIRHSHGWSGHSIASVEVIGIRDVAIVYRDRKGQVLYRSDPLANVTIVAKGFTMPEVTVRDSRHTPTRPHPTDGPAPSNAAMPVGCESAFSAIADKALARIPARCLSSMPVKRQFAAIIR
jgi:hypothetical protein